MTRILIEKDPILNIVPTVLDPNTPAEQKNAAADFYAHDEPDFPAWCRRLQAQIPGLYPAEVKVVADEDKLRAAIDEADGIIVENLRVDRGTLAPAKRLAVVQKFGTVINNIDTQACVEKGVRVETLRRRVNIAVAEQAWALLLALSKRICELNGVVDEAKLRAAGFNPAGYDRRYVGNSNFARIPGLKTLHGSVLGLIGMGEIGREIAARASGFGIRVLYYQRHPISPADEAALAARYVAFDELLAASNYISIQVPLNASTRHMLGRRELELIKPGAILANIARADLIERDALIAALESGRLAGFGLDVGYSEPAKPDDPLLKFKNGNVILLPHTAVGARQNNLNDLEEMCLKLWRGIRARSQQHA